jgi:diphthine methyl ester synthase
MVLYIIGLGLGDADDITVKGLRLVQSADIVILEAYTSVLLSTRPLQETVDHLQSAWCLQSPIVVADRDMVEQQAEEMIIRPAKDKTVAFLVVGDPVCATTHTDLWLRCRQEQIECHTIHNASIMGAAGACGLQLYNFGNTVSIPFFDEAWRPLSFYSKIQYNRAGGMHTLCLLDIKVKEPDFEAMKRGKTQHLPPRYMTIAQAAGQLIEAEDTKQEMAYDPDGTLCIGLARMGQTSQAIVAGTLRELAETDCGEPLHSLIIAGDSMHDLELEFVRAFLIENSVCTNFKTVKATQHEEHVP